VAIERKRITIAIAAMGGQGGGVLSDWIVEIGESAGYYVQSTSVPGVAQRTGTTIYYLELFPEQTNDGDPVLALMPVAGDVDIVIAAELAEAGRAVQRGIVTPDRTTLIASTHRQYALTEKSAMGDGRSDSAEIEQAIATAAKRVICFDMQAMAQAHGTVISATLFGALAGSLVLPFEREQFEAAISKSGKSVANNLAAFDAAFALPGRGNRSETQTNVPIANDGLKPAHPAVLALLNRVNADICDGAKETALIGVKRLIDYQDPRYANDYLDRLMEVQAHDPDRNDKAQLTDEVARHLALWMSYEDSIRVADLKIRRERFDQARKEVIADEGEIVYLTEYLHPRYQEVADTLPKFAGQWLLDTTWAQSFLTKFILRERKIHSSKIGGYLLLYGVASLRRFRRQTLRHFTEQQRIDRWLERITSLASQQLECAIEATLCQNLIKGYGDTHERGLRNFETIFSVFDKEPISGDTAQRIANLRNAALADEDGLQLRETLQHVA